MACAQSEAEKSKNVKLRIKLATQIKLK